MDKQLAKRCAVLVALAAVAIVGPACSDDDDERVTPCDAAKDLQSAMTELGDAEPGDLDEAAETVADDFEAFKDSVGDATREEITELGDQIGDLRDSVTDDDAEEFDDAIADVDEAWGALVDEIQQTQAECDLSA